MIGGDQRSLLPLPAQQGPLLDQQTSTDMEPSDFKGAVVATRRWLRILFAFVVATGLTQIECRAQSAKYPDRPVKILVGFSAGGGTDVVARIVAQKMSEGLGQSVVVENRPGVSGMMAAQAVAQSAPDGYTLMLGSQTTLAVAPNLYRKLSIDPTKDFLGVALAGTSPLVLVVHPSVAGRSVQDLIRVAKAKPGAINFGSGGLGTTPHMAGELFAAMTGIKIVHVAYRGEAPAINDLLGGQLQMMFPNLSAVIGNVKAGSLRALAVTSTQRVGGSEEIPTVAESGVPGFEAATWFALVAPAGTPREIVLRLNAEVNRVFNQPDVERRFVDLGMSVGGGTSDDADARIKSEITKWSKVIDDAGLQSSD